MVTFSVFGEHFYFIKFFLFCVIPKIDSFCGWIISIKKMSSLRMKSSLRVNRPKLPHQFRFDSIRFDYFSFSLDEDASNANLRNRKYDIFDDLCTNPRISLIENTCHFAHINSLLRRILILFRVSQILDFIIA